MLRSHCSRCSYASSIGPKNTFSWGVADRGCSIRVPRDTAAEGCGYLEDRRPSSNVDPYVATALLFETCTN